MLHEEDSMQEKMLSTFYDLIIQRGIQRVNETEVLFW